jgi:hypothetical protein
MIIGGPKEEPAMGGFHCRTDAAVHFTVSSPEISVKPELSTSRQVCPAWTLQSTGAVAVPPEVAEAALQLPTAMPDGMGSGRAQSDTQAAELLPPTTSEYRPEEQVVQLIAAVSPATALQRPAGQS